MTANGEVFSRAADALTRCGRLEERVLEALWDRPAEASVRDLAEAFPDLAYTTLMTTLDRLHRKGLLERRREGRAFLYRPRWSRAELRGRGAMAALGDALGASGDVGVLRPVLSSFVDAVEARDLLLLDELERLVREKRRQRGGTT